MILKGTIELPLTNNTLSKLADRSTTLSFAIDGVSYEINKNDYVVTKNCVIVNCSRNNNDVQNGGNSNESISLA